MVDGVVSKATAERRTSSSLVLGTMDSLKKIKLNFRFVPNIGIGYWENVYNGDYGYTGLLHTIVLPFCIIRWGHVVYNKVFLECPDCMADLAYTINDEKLEFIKHNN